MFGKCVRSLIEQMGIIAIIFTILSLFFPDKIQLRVWYLTVCITVPNHLFSFFTFQFRLFSSRMWIRRTIVMSFYVLVVFVMGFIFGYFRFEFDFMIVFGVVMFLFVSWAVFSFYVADKIEQKNLKLINQKLDEKNAKNM